jgi:hypothetical protein
MATAASAVSRAGAGGRRSRTNATTTESTISAAVGQALILLATARPEKRPARAALPSSAEAWRLFCTGWVTRRAQKYRHHATHIVSMLSTTKNLLCWIWSTAKALKVAASRPVRQPNSRRAVRYTTSTVIVSASAESSRPTSRICS